MPLLESFRLRELAGTLSTLNPYQRRAGAQDPFILSPDYTAATSISAAATPMATMATAALDMLQNAPLPPHSQHPDFFHLAGLVSEAVLEVVFVALPGFLVAYTGMFDANSQKFVAELNTMVFTPCLIFTKLASQLNADKLADLVVIPFIFAAQTLVSWLCAQAMARAFGFARQKRQKNFILAMGVFGNSNSLPISLVLSLSKTINGLHWDKIPGDNDNEVAARGILYLLIFQQLGQLLRWTWGYSVLLRPASEYEDEEREDGSEDDRIREEGRYRDEPDEPLMNGSGEANGHAVNGKAKKPLDSGFSSGDASGYSSNDERQDAVPDMIPSTAANGNNISTEPRHLTDNDTSTSPTSRRSLGDRARSTGHMTTFPNYASSASHTKPVTDSPDSAPTGWRAPLHRLRTFTTHHLRRLNHATQAAFTALPRPIRVILTAISTFFRALWRQMNPPLWAMLIALIVASIPSLQHLFFAPGTLISNSFTRAISQTGNVAVPLILVVLGANLARTTQTTPPGEEPPTPAEKREERNLLIASLLSRMLLPPLILTPFLALTAKYLPISILDDPIFIIVCFLLSGAPSALQLAQICQVNGVFMGVMSRLLLAGYVGWIFPSTLGLVLIALEVLEWAQVG
ncbi:hypothetical protein B0A50_07046 [Salinomyces thailandicus]|uniref:Auxin efflux carrier n=1 Tax=Salinomyces thailandicus TaxID=706561 RepID=A0A4U0TP16_9PEZI|nr:hypothetical protein B0A50_07046 [Salinomyces thailandica]